MQQTAAVATVFESKESTPSVRPRPSVEGYHKRTKGQERTSECSSETFAKEDKKMLVSSDNFCISWTFDMNKEMNLVMIRKVLGLLAITLSSFTHGKQNLYLKPFSRCVQMIWKQKWEYKTSDTFLFVPLSRWTKIRLCSLSKYDGFLNKNGKAMALEWPRKRCKNSVHVAIYFLTLFFFIQQCKNLQDTNSFLENLAGKTLYMTWTTLCHFHQRTSWFFTSFPKDIIFRKDPFTSSKKPFFNHLEWRTSSRARKCNHLEGITRQCSSANIFL